MDIRNVDHLTRTDMHSGGSSLWIQTVKIIPLPSYSRESGVESEFLLFFLPSPPKSDNRKRKEALIPPRDKTTETLFWRNPYVAFNYGFLIVSYRIIEL